MVDHIKSLLLNGIGSEGARSVVDAPSDSVMALFGVTPDDADGSYVLVDRLMPLALAPDLARFRRFYDPRVTPRVRLSVYRTSSAMLSPAGMYDRVLGHDGWWTTGELFNHSDPAAYEVLSEMRAAATSGDAPYAIGAVLLAVAYRRLLLNGGVS